MKAQPVQGKVQWIEGAMGGNIGLLAGDDGAFLIDTYVANQREELRKAVEAAAGKAPRIVLNTHWHPDHTGNNAVWGGTATVLAQENVRVRLSGAGGGTAAGLPIVTFDDGIGLHMNGEDIRVRHYAEAHTDGDSAVFFEGSKVLHTGDLFFNGRFPFIDLESGGSVEGMIAAVGELLEAIDSSWKVIPGHGPLATRADLEKYGKMLTETSDLVRKALAAGKNLEQIKKEDLLAPWKDWSWQFISSERFLETLVGDLSIHR
jgi:glyoxylase-like metal-dependent hydrolase (beta-lactamase superfamily II)